MEGCILPACQDFMYKDLPVFIRVLPRRVINLIEEELVEAVVFPIVKNKTGFYTTYSQFRSTAFCRNFLANFSD